MRALERNRWVWRMAAMYVLSMVLFGIVYATVYERNAQAFVFNTDILAEQKKLTYAKEAERLTRITTEIAELRGALNAAMQASNELQLSLDLPAPSSWIRDADGVIYEIACHVGVDREPAEPAGPLWFQARSPDERHLTGIFVTEICVAPPVTKDAFHAVCAQMISQRRGDALEARQILDSIVTNAPRVWSFWDFLYFSAITQATVGYGDILPNNTAVRLVVTLQTLIAVLLLSVLLNLSVATEKSD